MSLNTIQRDTDCCEIIPNLLLGSKLVPCSYLQDQKIDTAVCVAPENEVPAMESIPFYRFPVSFQADDTVSRENMICARDMCLDLLQQGKRVYLHCVAGFNRSPAVACMVLSRLYGIPIYEAVEFIRYFRNIAPEKHLALLKQEDVAMTNEQ